MFKLCAEQTFIFAFHTFEHIYFWLYLNRKNSEIPFTSAPIVKRHDTFTLEAADGLIVKVEGMINQTNTQNNGFSLEVC
jgi:SANTA (SANT Associated)